MICITLARNHLRRTTMSNPENETPENETTTEEQAEATEELRDLEAEKDVTGGGGRVYQ
jgi:hypothetical protein